MLTSSTLIASAAMKTSGRAPQINIFQCGPAPLWNKSQRRMDGHSKFIVAVTLTSLWPHSYFFFFWKHTHTKKKERDCKKRIEKPLFSLSFSLRFDGRLFVTSGIPSPVGKGPRSLERKETQQMFNADGEERASPSIRRNKKSLWAKDRVFVFGGKDFFSPADGRDGGRQKLFLLLFFFFFVFACGAEISISLGGRRERFHRRPIKFWTR